MINFKPMEGFIAVAQPEEVRFANGLHIPDSVDTSDMQATEGEVLCVGDGRMLSSGTALDCVVQPGDYVYWHPQGGVKVNVGGVKLLILGVDDLYGTRPNTVVPEMAVPEVVAGG